MREPLTPEQHRAKFLIGQTVLDTVGVPPGFVKIEAAPVGANQWRINLLVDVGRGCHRRKHCYYADMAADGAVTFNPPLKPLYRRPTPNNGTEVKPAANPEPAGVA